MRITLMHTSGDAEFKWDRVQGYPNKKQRLGAVFFMEFFMTAVYENC